MRRIVEVSAICFGVIALSVTAPPAAADIPVGLVAWDVTFPGNAGEFDIVNLSGPNAFPPFFPITTALNLSSLNLVVDFVGGSTETFGPGSGYFTLASDGESFNGGSIPIGGTNPQPIDATLSGLFTPTSVVIGGSPVLINPGFSVKFVQV